MRMRGMPSQLNWILSPLMGKWLTMRSEEHTSELQSRFDLVCRLLLEKKKKKANVLLPDVVRRSAITVHRHHDERRNHPLVVARAGQYCPALDRHGALPDHLRTSRPSR